MACPSEGQRIEESLEVAQIDKNLYKSIKLWKPANRPGAFGGNIIAQAAHAATKTVPTDFHLHSLHCYFISFGDVSLPTGIIYYVDSLRDGKSYVTRSVKASQLGRCIFTLLVSFHRPEPQQPSLSTHIDISRIPPPKDCFSLDVKLQKFINDPKGWIKPKAMEYVQRGIEESALNAIEIRNTRLEPTKEIYEASHTYWFRSRALVRSDPAFQKLVLAYASDFRFVGAVTKALGLGFEGGPKLAMLASLDHSMFFYDNEFDASQWMLYQIESQTARFGRGLAVGRIYSQDGRLLAVCTQEGVIRAEVEKEPMSKI